MRFARVAAFPDRIRRLISLRAQVITTVAGTDWVFPTSVTQPLNAPLGLLMGVAVDTQGNIYAVDHTSHIVVRIAPTGTLTVVAGNGNAGFSGDGGPAIGASLYAPNGIAVDSTGNLYIADTYNHRIRKVSNGVITTVAGNGIPSFTGDGGSAASASLNSPVGVALDSAGNLYIADTLNNRIRMVSGGVITTVAGNGSPAFAGDGGPATARRSTSLWRGRGFGGATFTSPTLSTTGFGRSLAGPSRPLPELDLSRSPAMVGPAASAADQPSAQLALDSSGILYITDVNSNRIRTVSGGTIATLVGAGTIGFTGDGGPATGASLNFPYGVAVDSNGNLYIADTFNYRVRKVTAGTIATIAGSGSYRFSGDGGRPITASLNNPMAVAVDSAGTSTLPTKAITGSGKSQAEQSPPSPEMVLPASRVMEDPLPAPRSTSRMAWR